MTKFILFLSNTKIVLGEKVIFLQSVIGFGMVGCSDSGCNYACCFMLLGDVWRREIFFFSAEVCDP